MIYDKHTNNDDKDSKSFIYHKELNDDDVLAENFYALKDVVKPQSALFDAKRLVKNLTNPNLLKVKKERMLHSSFTIPRRATHKDMKNTLMHSETMGLRNLLAQQSVYKCPGKLCSLRVICSNLNVAQKYYKVESELMSLDKSDAYKIMRDSPSKTDINKEENSNQMVLQLNDTYKNEPLELILIKKKAPALQKRCETPQISILYLMYMCVINVIWYTQRLPDNSENS